MHSSNVHCKPDSLLGTASRPWLPARNLDVARPLLFPFSHDILITMIPPPKQRATPLRLSPPHQPCPVHTTMAFSCLDESDSHLQGLQMPSPSLLSRPLSSSLCPKAGPETSPNLLSLTLHLPCQRSAFFQELQAQSLWSSWTPLFLQPISNPDGTH